jgi:hypothetical protein
VIDVLCTLHTFELGFHFCKGHKGHEGHKGRGYAEHLFNREAYRFTGYDVVLIFWEKVFDFAFCGFGAV